MPKLGVNIDHVATLRQARREEHPDPIEAARVAMRNGADSIVCHLREDRRHIQDNDVKKLKKIVSKKLNLEMSLNKKIVAFAAQIKPDYVMFVPEKRQEITTEGGLNVVKNARKIKQAVEVLSKRSITISMFVDPVKRQIKEAHRLGASIVELHTGTYANARGARAQKRELAKIEAGARFAKTLGLTVHAGHGLNYDNVSAIAEIKDIDELNIGHAIISRAVFTGLGSAVRKMKRLVKG